MKKPKGEGPHIQFGRWLRAQRERVSTRSQLHSQRRANDLGLTLVKQGKLSHLERGWNGHPDPDLLSQVAELYRVPYARVVQEWVRHRFGVSLVDVERAVQEQARRAEDLADEDLLIARQFRDTTDERLREIVRSALGVERAEETPLARRRFPRRGGKGR